MEHKYRELKAQHEKIRAKIDYKRIVERMNSPLLTGNELKTYVMIVNNLNSYGFCTLSNETLAKHFGVSERTISLWVGGLDRKQFVNVIYNSHKHCRHIYLKGQKLMETPYQPLTEDYQMSDAQLKFHRAFPEREIDCDWPLYGYDIDKVIEEIHHSSFLMNARNLSLRSCLKHYNYIVSGGYRDSVDLIFAQKYLKAQKLSEQAENEYNEIIKEEFAKEETFKQPMEPSYMHKKGYRMGDGQHGKSHIID